MRTYSNDHVRALALLIAGIFIALTVASLATAPGIRIGHPEFAVKAFRAPVIGWILWLLHIRNLDAATCLAVLFVFLAGGCADAIVKMSLRPNDHPYGPLFPFFAWIMVIVDTALFYYGCSQFGSWNHVGVNWPAAILTAGYCAAFFTFSYFHILLWNDVRRQQ